ncbi:MAG: hypothetical protein ABL921_27495 [Pirellula sp.]
MMQSTKRRAVSLTMIIATVLGGVLIAPNQIAERVGISNKSDESRIAARYPMRARTPSFFARSVRR